MSEQEKPKSFMEELDLWSLQTIIEPLLDKGPDAIGEIKRAIRQKVLESYRNGQKTRPQGPVRKEQRSYAKAQTRL